MSQYEKQLKEYNELKQLKKEIWESSGLFPTIAVILGIFSFLSFDLMLSIPLMIGGGVFCFVIEKLVLFYSFKDDVKNLIKKMKHNDKPKAMLEKLNKKSLNNLFEFDALLKKEISQFEREYLENKDFLKNATDEMIALEKIDDDNLEYKVLIDSIKKLNKGTDSRNKIKAELDNELAVLNVKKKPNKKIEIEY